MNKRENKFKNVNESKERFSTLPIYVLESRLNVGSLTKVGRIAINEIIKEKKNKDYLEPELNKKFLNGKKIKNVKFSVNDYVKIINGFLKNKCGSIISLESLLPEPIYLIELEENLGDREIPQSSIRVTN